LKPAKAARPGPLTFLLGLVLLAGLVGLFGSVFALPIMGLANMLLADYGQRISFRQTLVLFYLVQLLLGPCYLILLKDRIEQKK
jgi:hypothetical protein